MKTRHLEADQWLNRKEWCLGSGRRRQLSQDRMDGWIVFYCTLLSTFVGWHTEYKQLHGMNNIKYTLFLYTDWRK